MKFLYFFIKNFIKSQYINNMLFIVYKCFDKKGEYYDK